MVANGDPINNKQTINCFHPRAPEQRRKLATPNRSRGETSAAKATPLASFSEGGFTNELNELEEQGMLEKMDSSEWVSPIVFTSRRNMKDLHMRGYEGT